MHQAHPFPSVHLGPPELRASLTECDSYWGAAKPVRVISVVRKDALGMYGEMEYYVLKLALYSCKKGAVVALLALYSNILVMY